MKANELMVGDWVLNRKKFTEVKPIRITQVDFCLGKADGIYAKDYLDCDPIPLTPKILEKNGFSQDPLNGHIFIFQEKSGEVIYYEYGPKYGLTIDNQLATVQDLKIQYVHKLQHAFRLCGIEKEITL